LKMIPTATKTRETFFIQINFAKAVHLMTSQT
jgi:hypothetical protein